VSDEPPPLFWALNPTDERIHAAVLGDVEALCGVALPAEETRSSRPWGVLCLPCAISAAADLPDPGRMGTGGGR
jgi:hypothetical protein